MIIHLLDKLKFIYSEKATKFCEISIVDLSYVVPVNFMVEISQNFVTFSEYMNFIEKAERKSANYDSNTANFFFFSH